MLEAMACGVPVVQPAVGAFPEIINKTGGGILYEPDAPGGLRKALEELLIDRNRAHELGRRGREAVLAQYSVDVTMENVLAVYESLVNS